MGTQKKMGGDQAWYTVTEDGRTAGTELPEDPSDGVELGAVFSC